ncbi:MAG: hypothetical protein EX285_03080 [Thaumarchaeota archaeon]|nr:hypothetical protein [Nitrososphaerota archaeon]
MLQNGYCRFNGIWKTRGVGKLHNRTIENLNAFERDDKLVLSYTFLKNTRLISAICQNKIKNIGKLELKEKIINLNGDRKRLWLDKLTSIDSKECNASLPLRLACPSEEGFMQDEI